MLSKLNNEQIASRTRSHSGGLAKLLWNAKGAIALALLAMALPACTEAPRPEAATPDAATTVADVAQEPNAALIGRTVTVNGEIERVLGPRAFILEGKGWLFNDPEVLVVSATGAPLVADTPVVVTGTLGKLVVAEIEREYGFDLDQEYEVEFRDRPVVVATAVALRPTLDDITEKTNAFLGRTVTVTGEVDDVLSPRAFTIDDNDLLGEEDLLVVNATTPVVPITEDSRVQVTGPVRRFIKAEIDKEFEWGPGQEFEVEYENKPAIIARAVQPATAAGAAAPAPATPRTAAPAPVTPRAAAPAPAAPTAIIPQPTDIIGRTITASVIVSKVLSPRVFIVQDDLFYGGLPILVTRNDTTPPIREGEPIEITGTFRQLVVANVEREFDYDLAPEVEVEFRTRPYLFAKAIEGVD